MSCRVSRRLRPGQQLQQSLGISSTRDRPALYRPAGAVREGNVSYIAGVPERAERLRRLHTRTYSEQQVRGHADFTLLVHAKQYFADMTLQQHHQQAAQPTSGASHNLRAQPTSGATTITAHIFIAAWPTSGACTCDSSADIGDCIVNIIIKSLADIGSFYIKNELLG